jgi:hypothetical protein
MYTMLTKLSFRKQEFKAKVISIYVAILLIEVAMVIFIKV